MTCIISDAIDAELSRRPALMQRHPAPSPTLALPERSETRRNEIIVIDG